MELALLAWKRPRLHFVISHSAGEAFEVDLLGRS